MRNPGLQPSRPAQRNATPEPLPDGAAFTTHSFSNEAGSRAYKLYVPAHRCSGPPPLIVMLHGRTQSTDHFAVGNRTDFIRTAIRNLLDRHGEATRHSIARKRLDVGLRHVGREELEALHAAGRTLDLRVLGMAVIASDVSAELACATVGLMTVLGALQASAALKSALAERMR